MRIIKQGLPIGHTPMEGKCVACGCEIECTLRECRREVRARFSTLFLVNCPNPLCYHGVIHAKKKDECAEPVQKRGIRVTPT